MLEIILCENDFKQKTALEKIINQYLVKHDRDMTFVLSTNTPEEVMHFLQLYVTEKEPHYKRLYFLDIDLQHEISGIDLGVSIREKDFTAKIVFITTHHEMTGLVFKEKIEALDYILKDTDDVKNRIYECLDVAYTSHMDAPLPEEHFTIKTKNHSLRFPLSEILYFETDLLSSNRIILHMKQEQINFRGTIREVLSVHEDFFHCHRSMVVNVKNIQGVDRTRKLIHLVNEESIPVSSRRITALLEQFHKKG